MNETKAKDIVLSQEFEVTSVSHVTIAEMIGIKAQNVLNIIDKYEDELKRVGTLFIKKTTNTNTTESREVFLDVDASSLLMTFSKNTPTVVEFKVKLLLAFKDLRALAERSNKAENVELRIRLIQLESDHRALYEKFEKTIVRIDTDVVETQDSMMKLQAGYIEGLQRVQMNLNQNVKRIDNNITNTVIAVDRNTKMSNQPPIEVVKKRK